MITTSFRNLRQLERDYHGALATIRNFEAMELPPCPTCVSTNTALLQAATSKFKLTPGGILGKSHWCNRCNEAFS